MSNNSNRLKSFITISLISSFYINTSIANLLTNCPPYSAITHKYGESWKLDPIYIAEGWYLPEYNDYSSRQGLPPNGTATVGFYRGEDTVRIECAYSSDTFSNSDFIIIYQKHSNTFTDHDADEFLKENPNFKKIISNNIECDTVNLRIVKLCSWRQWGK